MNQDWKDRWAQYFGVDGQVRLNLGCALNREEGFINLDKNAEVKPDVVWDMEVLPLPFEDNMFDCILGSHVFEHVWRFVPLVEDLWRILKPGGYLISVTPYCSSNNSIDNPHHVRSFSQVTWHYFDQRLYQNEDAGKGATEGYHGNFQVVETSFVPFPKFFNDPDLEFKIDHYRNVVQELQVVLQKHERVI